MFTRVFTSILDSSINMESVPPSARWLWITMLLIADDERTGVVDMPIERLAARAGLSKAQTLEALEILGEPDPDSSSPDEDGRRIVPIDPSRPKRGWRLVNYDKYRQIASAEQKREQSRLRVDKHRHRSETEKDETPETALESTNASDPIPTHVPTPDFAIAARIRAKIDTCGLKVLPPDPLIVAWTTSFGESLIIETIEDVLGSLSGKHYSYLQKILGDRLADPSQRPGKRSKRPQTSERKATSGGTYGPEGEWIPTRSDDYWGGN